MPAATCKIELRAKTVQDFAKLETLLDQVPPTARIAADTNADGTTLKDIVGHRAHWITLFLGWYEDGQQGKDVSLPAAGYKWNDLKRFNADLRATQSGLDWDEARQMLRDNHARLLGFIDSHCDTDLYSAPMKGGNNHWSAGRWAEAAGPSHYRSAANYIRARVKAASATKKP